MSDINLLNDITNTNSKKSRKSLFGGLFSSSNKDPKKPKKSSPKLRSLIYFFIPLIACIALEGMFEEWALEATQKLTRTLSQKQKQLTKNNDRTPTSASPMKSDSHAVQQLTRIAPESWIKLKDALSSDLRMLAPYNSKVDPLRSKNYLQQMSQALPKEVWVKRFSIQTQKPLISVEGYAFTSESVLLFLSNLKKQSLFQGIDLSFSKPTRDHGLLEHHFQMKTPGDTPTHLSWIPIRNSLTWGLL